MEYQLIQGVYRIPDFDKVVEDCKAFIVDTEATNTDKRARTLIRKKKEEVATVRKEAGKAMLAVFNRQCKQLEAMLQEADDILTAEINANKEAKPLITTITIKTSDEDAIKEIEAFLNAKGIAFKSEAK